MFFPKRPSRDPLSIQNKAGCRRLKAKIGFRRQEQLGALARESAARKYVALSS
jgi:hypothetical protein